MKHYDIIIVGGGMVGATLAAALKNPALNIAMLDAVATHAEDKRLIALNHSSFMLFHNLAIWPSLENSAAAIREVHVSNRGHFGTTCLTAEEIGLSELGFVVPAKNINSALYSKLTELKNVTLLRPAKLTGLDSNPTQVTLTIELESIVQTLTASVVIAADGTFSTVRELLNIPTEIVDYQQKALVTVTELQRSHQHVAYERFLPNGAIAMLPLTGHRAATIWSANTNDIDKLLQLSDSDFLAVLQKQFGYRLGKLLNIEQRFVYPLKLVRAKKQISERIILIGNAAHTVHPIAAQGLNLALYEIAVLADHLNAQHRENLSLENIPSYLEQQNASINVSHYLTRLFSSDFFLVNALRQIGMVGLDICPMVKKRFMQRVLGESKSRLESLPSRGRCPTGGWGNQK